MTWTAFKYVSIMADQRQFASLVWVNTKSCWDISSLLKDSLIHKRSITESTFSIG